MSGGKAKGAEGKGKGKGKDVKTALPRSSLSPELELLEWRKDVKVLKGFFQSFLWKYPVHAFVGEVVKGQLRLHMLILNITCVVITICSICK